MTAILLGAAGVLAVIAVLAVVVRVRLVRVTVRGTSMLPTLRPGDRVLVRRTSARSVRRGDLVVFAPPREPDPSWMIKRVLAAPGDPVPRDEVPLLWTYREALVPRDRVVVIGDNPDHSYDSRQFGYVPARTLLGVVVTGPRRRLTGYRETAAAAGSPRRHPAPGESRGTPPGARSRRRRVA